MDYVCGRCGHHNMARNSSDDDDDDDEPDCIVDQLKDAIFYNDVSKFVSLLKRHYRPYHDGEKEVEDPNPIKKCPPDILQLVSEYRGVKCLTALLEGDTCFFLEDEDLKLPFENGNYPIHQATGKCNLDMVEFLISRGARTDVRTLAHSNFGSNLLPLDILLKHIRSYNYLNRNDWPPEESIYKLVIILCLIPMEYPKMWELLMLLASNTKEIEGIFNYYAKEGKLIEMALLLMVAKERIMDPSAIQSNDGFIANQSMIINQSIKGEILSLFDKVLIGKGAVSEFIRTCRSKAMFVKSALMLLEVFDKAGDSIRSYIQSAQFQDIRLRDIPELLCHGWLLRESQLQVAKEKVVKGVATILEEAGFVLKDKDIDLTKIESELHKTAMSFIKKDTVAGSSSFSGKIKKPDTKPRAKPRQVESGRIPHLGTPVKGFHTPAVNGFRHYSNSSIYVLPKAQIQGKTSVTGPCMLPESRNLLAFLALSLKRGVRHV